MRLTRSGIIAGLFTMAVLVGVAAILDSVGHPIPTIGYAVGTAVIVSLAIQAAQNKKNKFNEKLANERRSSRSDKSLFSKVVTTIRGSSEFNGV